MSSGPFVPTLSQPTRMAMAGDDCSLHFDLDELTPKQQADHLSNQVLTAMLQVALTYMGKPEDSVCLYDTFQEGAWAPALERYRSMFTKMGLDIVALDNVTYHPFDHYYESVASQPAERSTLYMVSNSNHEIHLDNELLEVSQNLNSKVHFAEHAAGFGIPVPDTLVTMKSGIAEHAKFIDVHRPLMLKTLGLAGARNVTVIDSLQEANSYIAEYDDDMAVILQERLNLDVYTEMTVDLEVKSQDITITNVRQIMFADGLWVGNLLGPDVQLNPEQESVLLDIGRYAQSHGYSHPDGFNLGIDFFLRDPDADPELPPIVVTEINARWTGGLFPAELVRQLGIEDRQVVAFIDLCPPDRFSDYLNFLEHHLYGQSQEAFAIAPMGFAPFPMPMEGGDYMFVWQIVIDDFESFKATKELELGADVLITAPEICVAL